MSWVWTTLGTLLEVMLACYLFIIAAFTGSGVANGATLGKLQMGILNLSLVALPGLCVLSAGIVIYLHLHASRAASYWWYAMPLAATALYLIYAFALANRK